MEGQPPDLFRLFESRALAEQQAPAVVHYSRCRGSAVQQGEITLKSTSIDYGDLLIRASSLARTLLEAAQGSPRKRFLALYARPSIPMVVGVLGVLQSGNAYVPLDPTHPAPRKAKALRRLACCLGCVVVEAALWLDEREQWLRAECSKIGATVVMLDEAGEVTIAQGHHHQEKPPSAGSRGNCSCFGIQGKLELAYAMFTSGTTGEPSIVRVPHSCVVPNIEAFNQLWRVSASDTLFMASPLTFDPSVVDLFVSLSSGARLLLVSQDVKLAPHVLVPLLAREKVTVLQATPSFLHMISTEASSRPFLRSLRVLALGGEPFPLNALAPILSSSGPSPRIYNLYGTTECSVWATVGEVTESNLADGLVTIGDPLLDTEVLVRDADLREVKHGHGTLWIGGSKRVCLLEGETEGCSWRDTGDLVYVEDRRIVYMGRKDNQFKVHGKRLMLEAIESELSSLPNVVQCKAVYDKRNVLSASSASLRAFVVLDEPIDDEGSFWAKYAATVEEWRRLLIVNLEDVARPDEVHVVYPRLPITANAKIDAAALIDALHTGGDRSFAVIRSVLGRQHSLPESQQQNSTVAQLIEEAINALWARFLGQKRAEADYSTTASDEHKAPMEEERRTEPATPRDETAEYFLAAGGTSIDAVRFVEGLADRLAAAQVPHAEVLRQDEHKQSLYDCLLHRPIRDLTSCVATLLSHNAKGYRSKRGWEAEEEEKEEEEKPSSSGIKRLKTERAADVGDVESRVLSRLAEVDSNHIHLYVLMWSLGRANRLFHHQAEPQAGAVLSCRLPPAPLGMDLAWSRSLGKCIDASPLLITFRASRRVAKEGDHLGNPLPSSGEQPSSDIALVCVGSHSGRFEALDLATGETVWSRNLRTRIESSAVASRSGEELVVGGYDGALYILRTRDGAILWTFRTGDQIKASPALDPTSGYVWCPSHDRRLYCLDIYARTCVHSFDCLSPVYSSPAIDDTRRMLYVGSHGGRLFGLSLADPAEPRLLWTVATAKPIFSSPAVDSLTGTVVFGGCDQVIRAVAPNGRQLWQVETSGPVFSSPLLWKSFVLVGCNDGHLYVVQRHVGQQEDETATLALKIRADSAVTASPSLLAVPSQHDDPTGEERAVLAFCPSDNNVTLVGLAAFPHQQALQGGEERADQRGGDEQPHEAAGLSVAWRREVAISRRGKKVFSSPVILADRLLCASRDNSIYCFTLVP